MIQLIIILILGMLGFYEGRIYERHIWQKDVPKQMDRLCNQCNEIGIHQGYQKGLKTCSDILDSIDDNNRRY